MSNTISCGCGKTIPAHGDTTCHCAGCHRSFAGLAAFDRHRVDSRCTAPDPTAVDRGGRGEGRRSTRPLPRHRRH